MYIACFFFTLQRFSTLLRNVSNVLPEFQPLWSRRHTKAASCWAGTKSERTNFRLQVFLAHIVLMAGLDGVSLFGVTSLTSVNQFAALTTEVGNRETSVDTPNRLMFHANGAFCLWWSQVTNRTSIPALQSAFHAKGQVPKYTYFLRSGNREGYCLVECNAM